METKCATADNVFIRHATAIAIGGVTVLMLLIAAIFWRQNEASDQATDGVSHTYEVIGHIALLRSKLKDAELAHRGFILTGNDAYLEAYHHAVENGSDSETGKRSLLQHRSISQELALIRSLTVKNPIQRSHLDEIDGTIHKLLEYLAASIQQRKGQTAHLNPSEIQQDFMQWKTTMDHIRSLMRIMETEENHLLNLRMEVADHNMRRDSRLMLIAMIVFYVVMVLSIYAYQRIHERLRAQMVLYTQELESSEEELKQQREELKASNEEIESANEEMEEKNEALAGQNARIQEQSKELIERRRLVEDKAKEVERASKYKSEFLANMSHELRTPLNSLLILARMLAANEQGNLTDEQVEEARVIHNGGLELLGLINDILDLSKVEAGKLTMSLEDVAVEDIVNRMRQQFAPIAKEKSVVFPIKVEEKMPPTLYTDAQRVEQILKNLLSNAFKFTEQGFVTLQIRRPDPHEGQRGYEQAVAFSIIDTGIGIEPSKFKDIFEAFQQEDGSIDRHYGGTGLGLTIARKFAHMLGGEIHVRSAKGEGSIFTLVLPEKLSRAEAGDGPTSSVEVPPEHHVSNDLVPFDEQLARPPTFYSTSHEVFQQKEAQLHAERETLSQTVMTEFLADDRTSLGERDKVLLIIEDDPDFATTLMKIARKRGYKCLAAGNGQTGLVLAVEQPVTAIVLDLKLPDIDGLCVLDQLKHGLRTRHIPVHVITGREEAGTVVPLRKGAIGYLTKPVDKEAIDGVFITIEELLRSDVKQVLVVEDDQKTQLAIQGLLRKKDIEITLAGTGTTGMNHLRERVFDCVILDLQLPDMTGIEWLENMENAVGEPLPPVIVYTARELSEEDTRKLTRYTDSIIIKGAKSPERLLDEVTLFLHSVTSKLPKDQQDIIRMQYKADTVLQGRTLLLVDDDLRNTFALSKLLKKHGLNIVIADNGQMALDKLNEHPTIALIIMDIMMPVMDGYQAMQAIRAQPPFTALPIIALTARAMPGEQDKCIAAGANDYLTKPVDVERLLTLLRVWLFRQDRAS